MIGYETCQSRDLGNLMMMFTQTELADIKALKIVKNESCKCQYFRCKSCRRIKSFMCRKYHLLSDKAERSAAAPAIALAELKMRIAFEYVHDILEENALTSTKAWIHSEKREEGHQKRIYKLKRIANI